LSKNPDWLATMRRLYSTPHTNIESFNGVTMLTRGLLVNGVAVGHIHVSSYFRPFTEDDVEIIELIAPRLALELYQYLCVDGAQQTATDTFLHYLLSGHTLSPESIHVKTALLDWHPGRVLYVLYLDPFTFGSDLSTIASQLLCGSDDRYTIYENAAVIILSRRTALDHDGFVQVAQYFDTLGVACGMSRALHSLTELAEGFRQAKASCEIGARVFARQFLHPYDACLPYVLIQQISQTEDILRYCMPELLDLAAEDATGNSSLMRTLWLYLECGRSITAVAERLGIHKNTVTFRLNKIADTLGIDWGNPQDQRRLMHSISILEYVDRTRYFGAAQ
jgi:hypothetical protein